MSCLNLNIFNWRGWGNMPKISAPSKDLHIPSPIINVMRGIYY